MFLKTEECCRLHKSSTFPSSILPVVYYASSKRSNLNQLLLRIPMCCKSITYQKCQLTQTLTKLSKYVKISTTDWHCKKKSTIKFIAHYYSLNKSRAKRAITVVSIFASEFRKVWKLCLDVYVDVRRRRAVSVFTLEIHRREKRVKVLASSKQTTLKEKRIPFCAMLVLSLLLDVLT